MFATCLFCNNALGRNEALEEFTVGRRLAFDGAKGRLWVICTTCNRWNLSPLETRWEAIESAERAFRESRMRVSTENIGMARLREGLELVRIGAPQRPEFAAWRYGDQFGKRYRKAMIFAAGLTGVSALSGATNLFGAAGGVESLMIPTAVATSMSLGLSASTHYRLWKKRSQPKLGVRDNDGKLLRLTRSNATSATLFPATNHEWQITVPHVAVREAVGLPRYLGYKQVAADEQFPVTITGEAAHRALTTLLPAINESGGNQRVVSHAVDLLIESPNLGQSLRRGVHLEGDSNKYFRLTTEQTYIRNFPGHVRLALEMSVHEDAERRAMEGELAELEQRWKDADAIAKIADEMFLPDHIDRKIEVLRNPNREGQ